jgi:hypothetical protein
VERGSVSYPAKYSLVESEGVTSYLGCNVILMNDRKFFKGCMEMIGNEMRIWY